MSSTRHPVPDNAFYASQPGHRASNIYPGSQFAHYVAPEASEYASYYPEIEDASLVEDQMQYDAFGEPSFEASSHQG